MHVIKYSPQTADSVLVSSHADTVNSSAGLSIKNVTSDSSIVKPVTGKINSGSVTVSDDREVIPPEKAARQNYWNTKDNFLMHNGLSSVHYKDRRSETTALFLFPSKEKSGDIIPLQRVESTNDWLFIIFLLLTLLFAWIKVFYNKFYAVLASSINSYQISAKLFRERNVLSGRVSSLLNFIYLIVFSVFIFEVATSFGLFSTSLTSFNLYLVILNSVILYTIFRGFILQLTGFLFLVRTLMAEYLHSTFVINKGLAIILFPVIILQHYLPPEWSHFILLLGGIIIATAFAFKALRAYKIIIRRDVLLFYLILYLCTLEILPFLLGYKVVKALILSY